MESFLLLLCLPLLSFGFAPSCQTSDTALRRTRPTSLLNLPPSAGPLAFPQSTSTTALFEQKEGKKSSKGPFDEGLRNKLVSESIAPWRTLRLFLYFALGSGAFIGGLITLSATVAAVSSGREDFDINTEVSVNENERFLELLFVHEATAI